VEGAYVGMVLRSQTPSSRRRVLSPPVGSRGARNAARGAGDPGSGGENKRKMRQFWEKNVPTHAGRPSLLKKGE